MRGTNKHSSHTHTHTGIGCSRSGGRCVNTTCLFYVMPEWTEKWEAGDGPVGTLSRAPWITLMLCELLWVFMYFYTIMLNYHIFTTRLDQSSNLLVLNWFTGLTHGSALNCYLCVRESRLGCDVNGLISLWNEGRSDSGWDVISLRPSLSSPAPSTSRPLKRLYI